MLTFNSTCRSADRQALRECKSWRYIPSRRQHTSLDRFFSESQDVWYLLVFVFHLDEVLPKPQYTSIPLRSARFSALSTYLWLGIACKADVKASLVLVKVLALTHRALQHLLREWGAEKNFFVTSLTAKINLLNRARVWSRRNSFTPASHEIFSLILRRLEEKIDMEKILTCEQGKKPFFFRWLDAVK